MVTNLPDGLFDYDAYAAIDDGNRYQIVDGIPVVMPVPDINHQLILGRLHFAVSAYVRDNKAGDVVFAPVDVVLRGSRPATILQPDLLFISNERRRITTAPNVQGAPDLVAEVLSPSTAMLDLTRKRAHYARHGVHEYWVIWPDEQRIDVFSDNDGRDFALLCSYQNREQVVSEVLPELKLAPRALFKEE